MELVRVGIIGCGYWGPQLVRTFYELPSAEVIAVADLRLENRARVERQFPQVRTTADHEELLANPTIDAIVIATPVSTHFSLAKAALLSGKHLLVEKPLAGSVAEAAELVQLAEEHGLCLMVGHTFEYNPAVEVLRNLVQSGELGKIHYIDTARRNLGRFQHDVNVLWDLAPHDISILLYILDQEPLTVRALAQGCVNPAIHDVAYLEMTFPGNMVAHVNVSWLDPCKVRRVTVIGSQKMVVYNDISVDEKIRIFDKGVSLGTPSTPSAEPQVSYRYGDIASPRIASHEPLRAECEHYIESVQSGNLPRSDGHSGLRVVRILELAHWSLVHGGVAIDMPTGDIHLPVELHSNGHRLPSILSGDVVN